jgi:processive 1,2-diacylglycerol beta-glucosyltransferase
VLRPFLRKGLVRYLEREQPDLVVSVLPAINGVVAEASTAVGARREVVLTDWHDIHRLWVARGVQYYTAPTESARLDCIRFGAAQERVDVVGIPVRHSFATPIDRQLARANQLSSLALDTDRFTILVMAGAEGSPRSFRNIARLAQLEIDAQLIVVCGRSDRLRSRVQRLQSRLPVRAVGFVSQVAELMRAADVLVTKAGGLTLAEAFCSGVAVVIHDVLPGQEAGNLAFVLRERAADYAPTPARLGGAISELFRDQVRRDAQAERGARLARPYAAPDIARNLLARMAGER